MKRCVLTVVGLIALVFVSGCVSEADHKDLLAQNRRAQKQLDAEKAKVSRLQAERQGLEAQRDQALARAAKAAKDVQLLSQARADLKKDYDTLKALYDKATQTVAPPTDLVSVLPIQVDKTLRAFAKNNPDLIEYSSKHGMVKIKSDLTFAPGSTQIKENAAAALKKLVEICNDPQLANYHIYIAGHTDNMRIARPATKRRHPNNWYLSVHRAVKVQDLMTDAGLKPDRVAVLGFGEYQPVAPNKTSSAGKPLGNEANRRVEIWIIAPGKFLTTK